MMTTAKRGFAEEHLVPMVLAAVVVGVPTTLWLQAREEMPAGRTGPAAALAPDLPTLPCDPTVGSSAPGGGALGAFLEEHRVQGRAAWRSAVRVRTADPSGTAVWLSPFATAGDVVVGIVDDGCETDRHGRHDAGRTLVSSVDRIVEWRRIPSPPTEGQGGPARKRPSGPMVGPGRRKDGGRERFGAPRG